MIKKRILRYGLVTGIILCGLWLVAGCSDNTENPIDSEVDCSAARLSELVEKALASVVDVDTAYDAHLLSDPWTGGRANCESTAPDPIWLEGPWIKTREPCCLHDCWIFNETNFCTGFGVLKYGTMTFDTLRVQSLSETSHGWNLLIACGEDDGTTSLSIPLRVYADLDNLCIGEINVALPGFVWIDQFVILVSVVDGLVDVIAVSANDLYIDEEPSGNQIINDLSSDRIAWIASWMESDIEAFFGLMVKESVEAAYDDFVAECP